MDVINLEEKNNFARRKYYRRIHSESKNLTVEDEERLCTNCGSKILETELERNEMICPQCGYYFRMSADQRINLIIDKHTFVEKYKLNNFCNPLSFPHYRAKVDEDIFKYHVHEAITVGTGKINKLTVNLGVFDTRFRMGSMGQIVGEKILLIAHDSLRNKLPLILVTASGGARMQEGVYSLLQMAKTVAAIDSLKQKSIPVIIVLTDPTTGGVLASFATEGDFLIAEPKSKIGFAGKRVVRSTLHTEDKVKDVQTAEEQLKYGHIDAIVARNELKRFLYRIVEFHLHIFRESIEETSIVSSFNSNVRQTNRSLAEIFTYVRNTTRPTSLQYIEAIFDNLIELHGDRINFDDHSVYTALGMIEGIPITVVGQVHGRSIKENIDCNYGMVRPAGYRKFIRQVKLAQRFQRPIVIFVDTKGADPLPASEIENQAGVISQSIEESMTASVPIISVIVGEGGSGGALALCVSDYVNMLEESMYSVISPEGAAEILWHDKRKYIEAMKSLGVTSHELFERGLIDQIIPEVNEENHLLGFGDRSKFIRNLLIEELKNVNDDKEFLKHRLEKYTKETYDSKEVN